MQLVIYVKKEEKIICISEGDGCNLSKDDIANGYVDYLYYDIYDPQYIEDVMDGGMALCEKPIPEEFSDISEVVSRVLDLHYGTDKLSYIILSGEKYWTDLVCN